MQPQRERLRRHVRVVQQRAQVGHSGSSWQLVTPQRQRMAARSTAPAARISRKAATGATREAVRAIVGGLITCGRQAQRAGDAAACVPVNGRVERGR